MTSTARVALDDFNDIPAAADAANNGAPGRELVIVPLQHFAAVDEPTAEPLLGTPDDNLLPAGGLLLMYGDGGAGKTTLSIDAAAHLAAGTNWLGITITRPLKILLIENEGPRGPFRQRLANKLNSWAGQPFHPNINVLEEPWQAFTLTNPDYRQQLGTVINTSRTELVIVGPLASLGAKGTGTPDDINDFDTLIADLRHHAARPFAIWIVHHENKAGDVSGAWERYPDTLVHVQGQGNGRTRIHWRKARWSSTLHGTSSNLVWADGNSYTVEDEQARDLHTELEQAFAEANEWRTRDEAARLVNARPSRTAETLSQLVDGGRFEYQIGPPGRRSNAHCWRLKTRPDSRDDLGRLHATGVPSTKLVPLVPPIRGRESGTSLEGDPGPPQTRPVPPGRLPWDDIDETEVQRLTNLYGTPAPQEPK